MKGLAADIACADSVFRSQVIRAAIDIGFNGIGIAEKFVHIDLRPAAEQVCFLYGKTGE